jgi:hypothetical protein
VDIVAPSTVTFNAQFGAPASGGSPGEVVDAKVLQVLADGRARLAIANTIIDVVASVPLSVGATVRLAVKHTLDGIRLALLDPGHASGVKSLVPLTVDIASRAALEAAFPPAAGAHPQAHASSGQGAAGNATLSTASAASIPQVASPPLSPVAASAAALAQAVRGAAARQSGLGALFSDLAVAITSPELPLPVKAAMANVLALRVPAGNGLSADMLKQAFQRSGLFLEAGLAEGGGSAADLKAALLSLRQMLRGFAAADADMPTHSDLAAPSLPLLKTLLSGALANMDAAPLAQGRASSPAGQDAASSGNQVPPPYRGAPTTAQPELAPAIAVDTPPDEIGRVLLRDTEGALGRQTLLQAASLPDRPSHLDPAAGPRWHFEVPFVTPQGTTLAQFEIARDGHAAPAEGYKPVWRARFSVDVEPLGAVHAQVALIGDKTAVTLWAERPDAAARIRAGAADLKAALTDAAFEPDILVRDGAPPRPRETAAPAGRFLDRAT